MQHQPRIKSKTTDEKNLTPTNRINKPKTRQLLNSQNPDIIMSRSCRRWHRQGLPKTGPPQNDPLKPANPCLTRSPAGTKGRLCLDRRLDFNSRASQVPCGFNRSHRKAQEPGFRVSIPVFGGATFSS